MLLTSDPDDTSQTKTGAAKPLNFLVPSCPDAIKLPLGDTAAH